MTSVRARLVPIAKRATVPVAEWDVRTFDRIGRRRSPVGDAVLPRLTRLADHSKLWGALAVALSMTRRRRLRRAGGRGMGSVALASFAANQIGKRLAVRDRPSLAFVPIHRVAHRIPTSSSFPSGHSASAAAFATGVALEVPALAVPLAALAGAVGYSRIYTGVHFPSDVMAGAAVGVASAAALARVVPLPEVRIRSAESPPSAYQPPRPTGAGVFAVVNRSAGVGAESPVVSLLRSELPEACVRVLEPEEDLLDVLRSVTADAEVVAVAGGDGSVNAGAQIAMERNLPLLVLPAGTLNHFAGDLGVSDLADAVIAVKDGAAVRIAVGVATAGETEHIFLNTASFGLYPQFVAIRQRWENRIGKPLAAVLASARVLRHYRPIETEVDGVQRRVGLAFVGSNGYEPRGFAPVWRPDLAEGRLDVRLLDLSRRYPRTRFMLALLFGRLRQSRQYVETHPETIFFTLRGSDRLSVDGEIFDIGTSVRFHMRTKALTVFRPARVRN